MRYIEPATLPTAYCLLHRPSLLNRSDLPGCRNLAGSIYRRKHAMANGTVKWFNATKGFGFIQPEDGGKDVFVHISAVERAGLRELPDGQKVTYELQAGRDGRESAGNIELA